MAPFSSGDNMGFVGSLHWRLVSRSLVAVVSVSCNVQPRAPASAPGAASREIPSEATAGVNSQGAVPAAVDAGAPDGGLPDAGCDPLATERLPGACPQVAAVDLPPVGISVHPLVEHPVVLGHTIMGSVREGRLVPLDHAAIAAVAGVDPQHSAPATFVKLPQSMRWYGREGDSGRSVPKQARVAFGCVGSIELTMAFDGATGAEPEAAVAIDERFAGLPRRVERGAADQRWTQALGRLLAIEGKGRAPIEIEWIMRTDLDDDGTVDTVVYAHHIDWKPQCRSEGRDLRSECSGAFEGGYDATRTYSFIATATGTESELRMLQGWREGPMLHFDAFVVDANGDGAFELFVRSSYYEGTDWSVYETKDGRFAETLSYGCGL
jgi:hypothetical protein